MAGLVSPEEPGRMQRATRATRGVRLGKQASAGKASAPKPKLVLKKIVGHDEKSPMPLKYRCLRAAEEYRQRHATRAEALRRRNEMEREQREAYRHEMMLLIKKQKKLKGAGLSREGTHASNQIPQTPTIPASQKHVEKPAQVVKRSPEKPSPAPLAPIAAGHDSAQGGCSNAVQKMLPVEVEGCTAQLDVGLYNSIQDVIHAVKELHSSLVWSQSPVLVYTRDANVFNSILLSNTTPWRHFVENATGIRCIRR